jgi:hypothetical protein
MLPRFVSPEGVLHAPTINDTVVGPFTGAITDTLGQELGETGHRLGRRLAVGALAATAAGVVALDLHVTKRVFDEKQATAEAGIRPLDPEESARSDKPRLVVVPGYTNLNPYDIASPNILRQSFGEKYDIHALHFDPAHNNELTAQYFAKFFEEDKRPFSVLGFSMGSVFTLGALATLVEQDVEVPKLETLVMHCSPYNYDSIRSGQRRFAKGIALAERIGYGHYNGGLVLTKAPIRGLNGAVVKQVVDPRTGEVSDAPMLRSLIEGLKISLLGASPKLSAKQAGMFRGIKAGQAIGTLRGASVIGPHTRVTYIRPEEPMDDRIVDVDFAPEQWADDFAGTVGSFVVVLAGKRHVDPFALLDLKI